MHWWKATGTVHRNARRVLVTGSRGKSSIVRMLQAAFEAAGVTAYARITGVVPRAMGRAEVRPISRAAGAHVGEMRWWLRQLPADVQAIVLENSAINRDLQHLAGRWLQPQITVLSNTLPDHQEAWGPSSAGAAQALACGIPRSGKVLMPATLADDGYLQDLLGQRHCETVFAAAASGVDAPHQACNIGLALAVMQHFGMDTGPARQAMLELPADRFDFRILDCAGAELAMAFSANDISSTRALFESLQWEPSQTRIVYNHRADRPARLRSYLHWLEDTAWREVLIIGDRPWRRVAAARYLQASDESELTGLFRAGERIFGCGNIAGLPMRLAMQ